jgi:hypothetical protein
LKNPPWGVRRVLFYYFLVFLFLSFVWAGNKYLFVSFLFTIAILFTLYIIKNILEHGYYHQLVEFEDSGVKLIIQDYLSIKSHSESVRYFGTDNETSVYGKAYLDKARNKKECLFLDIVPFLFEKLIPKNKKSRCLFLGGGGFVTPLYIASKFTNSENEVVEISEKVIGVAKKYFFPLFGQGKPRNLKITKGDAIDYLKKTNKRFDFIFQDIFIGKEIPKVFLSGNWLLDLTKHLKNNGILIINGGSINSVDSLSFIFKLTSYLQNKKRMFLFLYNKNLLLLITSNSRVAQKVNKLPNLNNYLVTKH